MKHGRKNAELKNLTFIIYNITEYFGNRKASCNFEYMERILIDALSDFHLI